MQKQVMTPTQDSKDKKLKDRTLTLNVTPTLVWKSATKPYNIEATVAFSEVSSDPDMPGAVDPVSGDIDLSNLPPSDDYTDNIDITLVLDTSKMVDVNGNSLGDNPARWAHSDEGPTYTTKGKKTAHLGYCWFCSIIDTTTGKYAISPPIDIAGMKISRTAHDEILIDDDTADGSPTYAFCMAFVLRDYDDYYISIDPLLSSKGVRSAPPG